MNYVEQFQNLSKEEAIKTIYAALNNKALDALNNVDESERTTKSEVNKMKKTLAQYPDLWPVTKVKYKAKIAAFNKKSDDGKE